MREALQTVAHRALHVAGAGAHLAAAGARAAGGVAEDLLARVGLVGREEAAEMTWDPAEVERDAAEAVARQEARAAGSAADEAERVAEAVEEDDDELRTPSGIPAADAGHNPDTGETDLVQPGTADPTDLGALHAVESESETLRRAAREDKS